jgi:hypothetical protein
MHSSFWVGKCVWDTQVVLWQTFGGSILDIYGVMRIARLDATVHRRPPERTAWTVRTALAAAPVASSFIV